MKTDHLLWLPNLIGVVELISGKELNEREKNILIDILSLTHNDGYHYGCQVSQKIYNELGSGSFK